MENTWLWLNEDGEIRNHINAVICESLPSVVDGSYAGNYRVRMAEMVEAWNEKHGNPDMKDAAEKLSSVGSKHLRSY